MGLYEVIDFVLLLLAYGISNERTLKQFCKVSRPFQSKLAALWDRDKSPCASALSRFLSDITSAPVEALRQLLFNDLLEHGINTEAMGGLYDHTGKRQIIFDVDATREVARQRDIPTSQDYPSPRRRRPSCAPGYAGRKRGQVVRSRTTVQQAHTHEWLGAFGGVGNGDIWGELKRACEAIATYLQRHQLPPTISMVRLDAAYGWVKGAYICQQHSLGYLMRSSDYCLLTYPEVQERLAVAKVENLEYPDSGKQSKVYDLGFISWHSGKGLSITINTRLIVVCSDAKTCNSKIGKRDGDKIYELFVTNRSTHQLSATDIVKLYCGRGSFEQTLNEEDIEQDPDRWCSGNGHGQEFWQLICQWLWNTRLRLGFAADNPTVRRTLWSTLSNTESNEFNAGISESSAIVNEQPDQIHEKIPLANALTDDLKNNGNPSSPKISNAIVTSREPVTIPTSTTKIKIMKAKATGPASGKFSGDDFRLQSDGTIKCPADKTMQIVGRRASTRYERIIYEARISDCRRCLLAANCLGKGKVLKRGRSFSICLPLSDISETVPTMAEPITGQPLTPSNLIDVVPDSLQKLNTIIESIYWDDLPATNLRRRLPSILRLQQVEIDMPMQTKIPATIHTILSRDERAHRRLTWSRRLNRNAAADYTSPWCFHIHGVPAKVISYIKSINTLAA